MPKYVITKHLHFREVVLKTSNPTHLSINIFSSPPWFNTTLTPHLISASRATEPHFPWLETASFFNYYLQQHQFYYGD